MINFLRIPSRVARPDPDQRPKPIGDFANVYLRPLATINRLWEEGVEARATRTLNLVDRLENRNDTRFNSSASTDSLTIAREKNMSGLPPVREFAV